MYAGDPGRPGQIQARMSFLGMAVERSRTARRFEVSRSLRMLPKVIGRSIPCCPEEQPILYVEGHARTVPQQPAQFNRRDAFGGQRSDRCFELPGPFRQRF